MSFREPNEDLFSNSRMSFGEHLEELRKVLIRSLIGVAIACFIGFYVADEVVSVLTQPLSNAANDYEADSAKKRLTEDLGYVPPEYQPWIEEGYIPRQRWIDPAQLTVALQSIIPDFADKVDLDPYGFRVEHFELDQLQNLCQRLVSLTGENDSVSKKLATVWNEISKEDQAIIESIANSPELSKEELIRSQTQIIGIFNRLSKSDSLFRDESFAADTTPDSWSVSSLFNEPQPKPLADLRSTLENPETPEADVPNVRRRLNRAIIASLFPSEISAIRLGVSPILMWEKTEFKPLSLNPTEVFFVWLKAGIFTGLTIAGPWVFFQIWSFVAVGLYPHERKYIHLFLPISILLFVAGVLLAYFFVFQPVLGFLFSFNRSLGIAPQMRIGEWLSFAMFLPLGFGVAFQLPLVMLFLNRIDLVSIATYIDKWRVAVMIIFVLSMFLTPADPISLLLLAIPLTMLYFLGIAMCYWLPKAKNPFDT